MQINDEVRFFRHLIKDEEIIEELHGYRALLLKVRLREISYNNGIKSSEYKL